LLARAKTPERKAELRAQLDGPPLPQSAARIWQLYGELAGERDYAGMGQPLRIKARDILAWRQLYRRSITPYEARLIALLDGEFLAAQSDQDRTPTADTDD